MKKLWVIMFTVVMIGALAGCGNSGAGNAGRLKLAGQFGNRRCRETRGAKIVDVP
ncbi:hypothetical protein HMSSN036_25700 [Paenibacillus macerans]|nr:hypothetical protein HMSSN036_25700 [Paenibacillus macerans]